MKILLTGGAGFIGSHLIEFLINKEKKINDISVVDNLSSGTYNRIKEFKKKLDSIKSTYLMLTKNLV